MDIETAASGSQLENTKDVKSKLEGVQKSLLRVAEIPTELPSEINSHVETLSATQPPAELCIADNPPACFKMLFHKIFSMLGYEDDGVSEHHTTSRIVAILDSMEPTTLVEQLFGMAPQVQLGCQASASSARSPEDSADIIKVREVKDDELQTYLKNNRCLIVIDGVIDEAWESIISMDSKFGDRTIVVIRNSEVATNVNDTPQPIPDQSSKELLSRKLNTKAVHSVDSSQLGQRLGTIVPKKCGVVELPTHAMASLTVHTKQKETLTTEGMEELPTAYNMYCLYYYLLPDHLKKCLSYLSIFKGDGFIERDSLIWMWIAEDIVHQDQGAALFEVGERYLNELATRSMIHPLLKYDNNCFLDGLWVCNKLVDLIHLLSSEQDFVIDNDKDKLPEHGTVRRFAFRKPTYLEEEQKGNMEKLERELKTLCYNECQISSGLTLPSFKFLRVLALVHCSSVGGGLDLKGISSLHELRYLGLAGTPVKSDLPIENLKVLQTLDVRGTGIKELDSAVGGLTQLMCLRADLKTRVPSSMDKLTSLEYLQMYAAVGKDNKSLKFMKDLASLKKLRVLRTGFSVLLDQKSEEDNVIKNLNKEFINSLRKLRNMHTLDLWCAHIGKTLDWSDWIPPPCLRHLVLSGIVFRQMPKWINSKHLPSLSELCVAVEELDEQGLQNLGGLPELQCLNLVVNSSKLEVKQADTSFGKLSICTMNEPPTFLLRRAPNPNQVHPKVVHPKVLQFRVKVTELDDTVARDIHSMEQKQIIVIIPKRWHAEAEQVEAAVRSIHPAEEERQIIVIILNCWRASPKDVEDAEKLLRNLCSNCVVIKESTSDDGSEKKPAAADQLRAENHPRTNLLKRELDRMRANLEVEVMRRMQLEKGLNEINEKLGELQSQLCKSANSQRGSSSNEKPKKDRSGPVLACFRN